MTLQSEVEAPGQIATVTGRNAVLPGIADLRSAGGAGRSSSETMYLSRFAF
jgi:hypothetical protein